MVGYRVIGLNGGGGRVWEWVGGCVGLLGMMLRGRRDDDLI